METQEAIVQVLVVPIDEGSAGACLVLARELRTFGISCVVDGRKGKLKGKLERADKLRSYYVIVIGPDDLTAGTAQVRDRDERTQEAVPITDIPRKLAAQLVDPDDLRRIDLRREVETFNDRSSATPQGT